jgi:hypothetical protein
MPRFLVASRLPSFAAVRQSAAVIVANANKGKSGFRFPGILSSASALQLQVQPLGSLGGLVTDLLVSKATDGQDRLP